MPPGSRLLTVGVQDGRPVLWADCDDRGEYVGRRIVVVMTGQDAPADSEYVGTFLLKENGERFVGHVFDCGEVGSPYEALLDLAADLGEQSGKS